MDIKINFTLRLNVAKWGTYKKGDTEEFTINVFDEQNGLVRFPIDKRWDIVSYELGKDKKHTSASNCNLDIVSGSANKNNADAATREDLNLWMKLTNELMPLNDSNYKARKIYDYIKRHYR